MGVDGEVSIFLAIIHTNLVYDVLLSQHVKITLRFSFPVRAATHTLGWNDVFGAPAARFTVCAVPKWNLAGFS